MLKRKICNCYRRSISVPGVDQNYRKLNGVLSYSQGNRNDGFSMTAKAFRGQWTSTDQVARRAVDSGLIDRFGSLD